MRDRRGGPAAALRVIEVAPDRVVSHDFHEEAGRLGRLYFRLYRLLRPVPA